MEDWYEKQNSDVQKKKKKKKNRIGDWNSQKNNFQKQQ